MDSTEAAETSVSLRDALELAVRLHRAGHLDDAETLYKRILEVEPRQSDALNFLAVISMHRGRIEESISLIGGAIEIDPARPELYNNRGNILLAAGRIDDAVAAYEKVLALNPRSADAWNNLGIIYKAQKRYAESVGAYERAIDIDPEHVEAYNNLGNLLAARGNVPGALTAYCKALTLRPHDPNTRRYIASAHMTLGEVDKAALIYREWLAAEPDHPGARHLLAACSGEHIPMRAADDYIETTFDAFSQTFDSQLEVLEYRAPGLVASAVGTATGAPGKRFAILDAGCGTGLCGPLLAPLARHLTGVDLSAGMLARAKLRGVYDELVKAELTQYLESVEDAFDVIVSADTLVYFGALSQVCNAAARALRTGAVLVFTVEKADNAHAPGGHRLNPHGRYSHTQPYVTRTLEDAGLRIVAVETAVLRMERGKPVAGLVVTARKDG